MDIIAYSLQVRSRWQPLERNPVRCSGNNLKFSTWR